MFSLNYVSGVILCAGCGRRMGADRNKLLLTLSHQNILSYTVKIFDAISYVDEILLVVSEKDRGEITRLAEETVKNKPYRIITGGATRQESSYCGVVAAKDGIVLIHDGARPFTEEKIIKETIEAAASHGAAAPGIEVTDTVKRARDGFLQGTVDRSELVLIQTPQGFQRSLILEAHEKALADSFSATDDCMLIEHMGRPVRLVEGSGENIKITTKKDILLAEQIVKERFL